MKTLTETIEFLIRDMNPTEDLDDMPRCDIERICLVAAIYNVTPSFIFRETKRAAAEWISWWENEALEWL